MHTYPRSHRAHYKLVHIITDVQLTANKSGDNQQVLECSAYGIDKTEVNEINIEFNDDPEYTCECLSGHNIRPDIELLHNKTTCQLTVDSDRIADKQEYFCTIRIFPAVYNGKSCILMSQTIPVEPAKGNDDMPNVKVAAITLGVISGVQLLLNITLTILLCKCLQNGERQGKIEQVRGGEKTVKGHISIHQYGY